MSIKNKGWQSYGDWLGTGKVADQFKTYKPFNEARKFARSLGLKSQKGWFLYVKVEMKGKPNKPNDIPSNPNNTFTDNGWKSWGDWLGTGRLATNLKEYRPFKEARKLAISLGLKSQKEWFLYAKGILRKNEVKPDNIPACPERTYKNKGWKGWGDWLGTGTIANYNKIYKPFKEARKFAKSLNLKTSSEWNQYIKREIKGKPKKPNHIPNGPGGVYKDKGWKGWGDWLGTGTIDAKK